MWRRNALVLVLVTVWTHPSPAQDEQLESLVARQEWARFDLVLGRITAVQIRSGQSRCAKTSEIDGVRESLSVSGDIDIPAIRYELVDSQQSLTIDVVNRNQVTIVREPLEDSQLDRIEFRQPSLGQLSLRIGSGDSLQEYQADSLWHLLLSERHVCKEHVVPILERLRPGWQLVRLTKRLEDELLRTTQASPGTTREQLRVLVANLDSPQFAKRRDADRRLRLAGVSLLTYIDELDTSTLTREQRQRIQRIRADMNSLAEDSAQRVAAWLQDDMDVWLAMLSHQEREKRAAAADRLVGICPDAAHFDPSANEGERQAQIDRLRVRIRRR